MLKGPDVVGGGETAAKWPGSFSISCVRTFHVRLSASVVHCLIQVVHGI